MAEPGTETETGRRALLVEAQLYGINLHDIATEHADGSATIDWDDLARAVAEARQRDTEGDR